MAYQVTVSDASTHSPISGASVFVYFHDGSPFLNLSSASDGTVQINTTSVIISLQVTAPGASAILIAPPATGLSYANGTVHTERGAVHIDWKRPVGGGLTLDLTLPTNVSATVLLPISKPASTSASGAGQPTFLSEDTAHARYSVGSGQSSFVVGN